MGLTFNLSSRFLTAFASFFLFLSSSIYSTSFSFSFFFSRELGHKSPASREPSRGRIKPLGLKEQNHPNRGLHCLVSLLLLSLPLLYLPCYFCLSVFLSFHHSGFPQTISHHLLFSLLRRRFSLDYHPSIIHNDYTSLCLLFHLLF